MTSRTAFVHKVWKSFLDNAGHDANCFESMKLVKVEKDLVICSLKVESKHLNRLNGLHGGLIASLIDTTGSLAVSTRGFWFTGVSTDISVTFVRGARLGEDIRIESKLINLGKNLAYTRVEVKSSATLKLLSFGSHTKFIAPSHGGKENVTF